MPEFLITSLRANDKARPNAVLEVGVLGPVRNATIELAPFVMLVGKNNTGKSYLANLIWAFRNFRSAVVGRNSKDSFEPPKWFRDFLSENHEQNGYEPLEIDGSRIADILNDWLDRHISRVVRRIFAFDNTPAEAIRIKLRGSIWLRKMPVAPNAFGSIAEDKDISSWEMSDVDPRTLPEPEDGMRGYKSHTLRPFPEDFSSEIFAEICERFVIGERGGHSTTYLPAARSGLMLSLPSLYASILEDFGLGDESEVTGQLPLATVRFLQALTRRRYDPNKGPHSTIADFLEQDVVRGEISREESSSARFSYAPAGSKTILPLHVTSSLVSEMAPFLFLLRNNGLLGGIVFEEPEAHLHLAAQRSMARAVARIYNGGAPVTLTTHSDTFVQQINVLGRLSIHPDREAIMQKHGYKKSEILDLKTAFCYEFRRTKNGTKVVRLKSSDLGFAVPSLNETLVDLAEESIETNITL